jgi:isopentenyl-diphosphate delta-isomerase
MIQEDIILVNEQDEVVGFMEKMEAHRSAQLHRAFSIFIFNTHGHMLLQQRASHKYHSGGLWTNACCSHPRPGEDTASAAQRRLFEELGFRVPLKKIFDFTYKSAVGNGLTEHEYDHVFTGIYDGIIPFNPEEVSKVCYMEMNELKVRLNQHPHQFTVWFQLAFPKMEAWFFQHKHQ